MSEFIVGEVIDGDTFKVKDGWRWNNKVGDTVRPAGYNTPEKWQIGYDEAKTRLTNLILNKIVDIRNAQAIDAYGRLIADVYYNGKNLADYFPEYKI
ncbi:thermonuclease family protein [Candidatus Aerophobetes bacterium]|nr:thermonuclease family protein [Candidatus Aerophobetes bacterium]